MALPIARRVVALALVAASLAFTVDPASCQQNVADAIRERLKARPDDATLHYYLAMFEIAAGRRAAGLASLARVEETGKGFLPPRGLGFDSAWTDPGFQKARKRLERKLPKVTAARELFRLGNDLIPEGIAWDPVTRSFFVGSIAAAKIVRIDSTGSVSELSRPGELSQVLGLAVDTQRRRLHAVSTSALAPGSPTNRVVSYDLETGARWRAVEVPGAAQLNDVSIGRDGELYTSDSRAGAVFRVGAGGEVDTIAAPGRMPGANGLAVSADGSALYVAHATGVARVALPGGEVLPRIEVPAGETIAAIDGLYVDGHTLIGVQNVTNPGRVIRMALRDDGMAVERVETLLSHHHPAMDEPTTGAVVGRSFVLLATTQVGRFTPEGKVESPATVKRPVVLAIELDRE